MDVRSIGAIAVGNSTTAILDSARSRPVCVWQEVSPSTSAKVEAGSCRNVKPGVFRLSNVVSELSGRLYSQRRVFLVLIGRTPGSSLPRMLRQGGS